MAQVHGFSLKDITCFKGIQQEPRIQGVLCLNEIPIGWMTDSLAGIHPIVTVDKVYKKDIEKALAKGKNRTLFGTVFDDLSMLSTIEMSWIKGAQMDCPILVCGINVSINEIQYSGVSLAQMKVAKAKISHLFDKGFKQVFVFTSPEDFIID